MYIKSGDALLTNASLLCPSKAVVAVNSCRQHMALISVYTAHWPFLSLLQTKKTKAQNYFKLQQTSYQVTAVVLTFVTDLCGFCHVAHIFPDVIQKKVSVCQNLSHHATLLLY
jgi:hypothetical protein